MENWNMRRLILLLCFLLSSGSILAQSFKGKSKERISVEKFILAPFTEVISKDSMKTVIFIEIPFSSLQFVKKGSKYVSYYQASISMKVDKGMNIFNKVWLDSMIVKSYEDTRSKYKNSKHFISQNIKIGNNYTIIAELQDLDTRKKGIQTKQIKTKNFKKIPNILPPLFLMDLKGEWGFASDKIPTKGYRVREIGNGITLKISGLIKSKVFSLGVLLNTKESIDSVFYSDGIDGSTGYFNQSIFIPSEKLKNIRNNFNIFVKQDGKLIEENVTFSIYKSGFSNSIRDIDVALNQMKYMLDNDQSSLLKSKKKLEREMFFNQIWEERDPTPLTEYNELMEEYFNRVNYTIEHFSGWEAGWETDRGMVYILFGAPDEINRYNSNNNLNKARQVWVYRKIGKEFSFIDQNGFGDYRLDSPFSLF
tara:strand:- start:181 stop:1446 length:1266 start_codon:yes stop_codon:yes gene_type:complete